MGKFQQQAKDLKALGSRTATPEAPIAEILETFPNANPERDYIIAHDSREWYSRCPKTGAPDTGEFHLRYIADKACVESKSLKLYVQAWANEDNAAFMERICNEFASALIEATKPRGLVLEMNFHSRGGINTSVVAKYLNADLPEDQKHRVAAELGIAV